MNTKIFRNPRTNNPLVYRSGTLVDETNGDIFPIIDDIPCFAQGIPRRHRFWQWVYDRTAFAYDAMARVGWRLGFGGAPILRDSYLREIEITPDALVLETAVGTGENIRMLPKHAHYVGLDISLNMLRQCQHKLSTLGRTAQLVQGDAQRLPFAADVFDVVFHMGGLQFLTDPMAAIHEMARVIKPGGRVLAVDETASLRGILQRGKVAVPTSPLSALQHAAPTGVQNVRCRLLSQGELFMLAFDKPVHPISKTL